jgi:hypothetical protein
MLKVINAMISLAPLFGTLGFSPIVLYLLKTKLIKPKNENDIEDTIIKQEFKE